MANVKVTLTCDEQRLLRALDKVIDKEKELARKAADTGKASTRSAGQWNKANKAVLGSIGQIAGALGIAGGVAGAVSQIVTLVREWQENMDALARKSAEAGREMTALAMMQKKGEVGAAVQEAISVGARYGYTPGQAMGGYQQLQAQLGSRRQAVQALSAAGRLSQWAGVDPDAASTAVSLMAGLGMKPGTGVRALYGAGEASSLSPQEIAEAAPKGLPGWKGTKGGAMMGLAVSAQLSEVIKDPGRLGTYTARAATGLFGTGKKQDALWEKLGIGKGADAVERLRALQGAGLTSKLGLQEAGIVEEREAQAISLLVNQIDPLLAKREKISTLSAQRGLLGGKRAAAEAELPQMRFQRERESLEALSEGEWKMPTTEAGRQRQRQAERHAKLWQTRKVAMQRHGDTVPEEGDISWRQWLVAKAPGVFTRNIWETIGRGYNVKNLGQDPLGREATKIEKEVQDVANAPAAEAAIQQNTEAVKELSSKLAGFTSANRNRGTE